MKPNADDVIVLKAITRLPKRHTAYELWARTGLSLNRISAARTRLFAARLLTRDRTGSRIPCYELTPKARKFLDTNKRS